MANQALVSYAIGISYAFEMTVFLALAGYLFYAIFIRKTFPDRAGMLTALAMLMLVEGLEVGQRFVVRSRYIVTGEVQILGWEYVVASMLTGLMAAWFYIAFARYERKMKDDG